MPRSVKKAADGFKIDKNVPMPDARVCYPFARMSVGDSFLAKGITLRRLGGSAYQYARTHGWKFSCRTVKGGVRCWRVK